MQDYIATSPKNLTAQISFGFQANPGNKLPGTTRLIHGDGKEAGDSPKDGGQFLERILAENKPDPMRCRSTRCAYIFLSPDFLSFPLICLTAPTCSYRSCVRFPTSVTVTSPVPKSRPVAGAPLPSRHPPTLLPTKLPPPCRWKAARTPPTPTASRGGFCWQAHWRAKRNIGSPTQTTEWGPCVGSTWGGAWSEALRYGNSAPRARISFLDNGVCVQHPTCKITQPCGNVISTEVPHNESTRSPRLLYQT
jgi:hypothetical protein